MPFRITEDFYAKIVSLQIFAEIRLLCGADYICQLCRRDDLNVS
jgi:hypothetical protein